MAAASTPRPLMAGALRSGVSQVVMAAAGSLTTLLLARAVGPAGAGVYAVALTLLLGLLTLCTLSLPTGIAVLVAGGRWSAWRALLETQYVAAGLGVLAVGGGLGVYALVPSAFRGLDFALVLATSLSVAFALSWTFASAVALAVDHYELYAAAPAIQACLGLVTVPPLAVISGTEAAIFGLAATQVVTAAIVVLWGARVLGRGRAPRAEPTGGELRDALTLGLKTHLSNVFTFFNYRLDLFILNATASASQVGQYSIAVSVTQTIWLLPRALSSVVTPRVAHADGRRAELGDDYLEMVEGKSLRHATLLSVGSAVAVAVALAVLVFGFLGAEFHESFVLGIILLPGSTLLALASALSAVVIGRSRPEYALWGAILTTPVAVALYVVLVPSFEAVGAAIASTVAYAVGFLFAVVLYRRMIGPAVPRSLVPTRADVADYRALIPRRRKAP